jgi:hypothetical protein
MEEINFDAIKNSSESNKKNKSNKSERGPPSDIPGILADLFMSLPWSLAFILFIMYILMNSDIFINGVLGKIKNASKNMVPTNKGTLISAMILAIVFMVFYMLICHK